MQFNGEKTEKIWTKPNCRQTHRHPHQCPAQQHPAKDTPGFGTDLARADITEDAADQKEGTKAEGKPEKHKSTLHEVLPFHPGLT